MKAEVKQTKFGKQTGFQNTYYVSLPGLDDIGFLMETTDIETAQKRADQFNSALSQHVQSELSSKIEQLKEKFSDEWIENEYGLHTISGIVARMLRDELFKELEK